MRDTGVINKTKYKCMQNCFLLLINESEQWYAFVCTITSYRVHYPIRRKNRTMYLTKFIAVI